MSRRARTRVKPAYIWGALSNTEPPEDEDAPAWVDDDPEPPYFDADAAAWDAVNAYEAELDARASQ
jgi:hypothetical protein